MKLLVTGGAGYIGSVMTKQLLDNGQEVVVYDNLGNGNKESVDARALLEIGDLGDQPKLASLFDKYRFDGVIHFAGVISMTESMEKPEKYFRINTDYTRGLLEAMKNTKTRFIIFSSTAGVYGNPTIVPIPENHPKNPTNPYGESKLMIERLLFWYDTIFNIKSVCLRYFNAAGASLDGKLGELHKDESHIIPLAIKALLNKQPFTIYGTDYDTPDGTCVRDYIHVEDLASAHLKALDYLKKSQKSSIYNVGTGKGCSNREVVAKIEEVSGRKMQIKEGMRRPGDAHTLVADPTRIKTDLGWTPEHSDLTTIVKTAWNFHSHLSRPERSRVVRGTVEGSHTS